MVLMNRAWDRDAMAGPVRLLVLALLLPLLAGCASDTSAPEEVPEPAQASLDERRTSVPGQPEEEDQGPLDETFHGMIYGAGVVMPDGSNSFAGVSTYPEEFRLRPGATLDVTLTWNLTAPSWVNLILTTPEGQAIVLDGGFPNDPLGRTLHYNQTDATPGAWTVVARSQGPAVVDYTIHVVATYPAAAAHATAPMAS